VRDDGPRFDDFPIDPDLTEAADPGERPTGAVGQRRRWDVVLVVAAGGALGGGARWTLNQALPAGADGFPWAAMIENVSGCLLLGALMVFLIEVWAPHRYARPFLGVGVLGGFTTFSTYTSDTRVLLLDGSAPRGLIYLFGTLILALAATWTGISLARTAVGIAST